MRTYSKTLNIMCNIDTNTKIFTIIPTFKIDMEIHRVSIEWICFTLHIKPITI